MTQMIKARVEEPDGTVLTFLVPARGSGDVTEVAYARYVALRWFPQAPFPMSDLKIETSPQRIFEGTG